MSQNPNIIKRLRQAIKELDLQEIEFKTDMEPKGTTMLRVKSEDEGTIFNVITNELEKKLFISVFLPIEYEELASKDKDKQHKLYEFANEFNSRCRNLKCFITNAELGRMIFSTETRHELNIKESGIKDELTYSIDSARSAISIFNGILKD